MRIFVNNVDGHLAGAVCADLRKLTSHIIGTRKTANLDLVPPVVKKVVQRVELRRLLKIIASCDVVVYDLHDADLEELELVLRILYQSEITQELTLIIISSVGVWARTQREYESVEEADAGPDETAQEADAEVDPEAAEEAAGETPPPQEGEAEAGEGDGEASEQEPAAPPRPPRPKPLKSEDYVRRIPAPKFQEWRTIETLALSLKEKQNVRPYVVCAGMPYGNGEECFLGLFKAAWQTRPTLRVIGDGFNTIPLVHVRDCARLVRRVAEERPELDYHLAVDRGDNSQREIVEAVAGEFGLKGEIKSVSIPEAILAELADMLTLDLRLLPSDLMAEPAPAESSAPASAPGDDAAEAAAAGASGTLAPGTAATAPQPVSEGTAAGEAEAAEGAVDPPEPKPPSFRWWSEKGLVSNVGRVGEEFRKWRQLEPVRFCIMGPPGSCSALLGKALAERYNLPHLSLEDLIEEQRHLETPTGQALRDKFTEIEAAFANPKSAGPWLLPSSLTAKVVEEALATKPCEYRGWVLSGYPQTLEEATEFFLIDDPNPPGDDDAKAKDPKAAKGKKDEPAVEKVPRPGFNPDAIAVVSAPEESCLARMQAMGKPEDQWMPAFKKKFERWQKEFPEGFDGITQIVAKLDQAPVVVDEPPPDPPAEEGAAAGGDPAAGGEGDAAPAEDDGDDGMQVLPYVAEAAAQMCAQVEVSRHVNNFLAPPALPDAEVAQASVEEGPTKEELEQMRRQEEEARRKREAEERLEQAKKEELARLEKHSEPLRQYLMSFVVPTVTSGLVEVCRAQPDDPVGYLAEYLSVYSQLSRRRSINGQRLSSSASPGAGSPPQ